MGWHLAGDDDKRDRIQQRIGQAGHGIGRTGPDVTSTQPTLPDERA